MTGKPISGNHFYWHVLLLGSLIFSHPLFKALSGQPEFLLAHNLSGFNLLWWILIIAFVPGLSLLLMTYVLTRLLKPLEVIIKYGTLFILFSLFLFLQITESTGPGLLMSGIGACLLALIATWLYGKSIYLRTVLSYATFLVVITPLLFTFDAEVRKILLPHKIVNVGTAGRAIDKTPVVILLLDELPLLSLLDSTGNINGERFPNFARFSAQSTWYKYTTTVAEATLNAVPPILTGQLTGPSNTKLPVAGNYPDNLFTLLSASHEINAFETFTHICPESLCKSARPDWGMIAEDTLVVFGHATAPEQYKQELPQIDNKWVGYLRGAEEVRNLHADRDMHPHHRYKVRLEKFDQFISELEYITPASLNYLHILMPHSPWMYLPDGRIYSQTELRPYTGTLPPGTPGAIQTAQLYSQSHLTEYANQRHLLQVGYVDKLLGDLLATLKLRGIFEDALIIVMADHGASFRPGESLREANEASYQDILSVPLFIKYPGQKHAETSLRAARTLDVLPTIMDTLNTEFSHLNFDGHSLLRNQLAEQPSIGLQRDTGEVLNFQFSDFKHRFEQAVKSRKKALTDGDFQQIYALNDQAMLNREILEFPVSIPAEFTIRLDNPHEYTNIDLSRSTIPSLIRANRSMPSEAGNKTTIAVAVNGVIRGVSELRHIKTMPFDYQVMVAPESFRNGGNDIRFYQVHGTTGSTILFPVNFESRSQVELTTVSNNSMSLSYNSIQLPVARTGDHGELIIIADNKAAKIRLTGWAANSDDGKIAAEIFLFSGDKLITSVKPHSRYPKAQEITGFANAEYSGFNLIIPTNDLEEYAQEPFTAIAIFEPNTNPVAGELRYTNRAGHLFKTRKAKPRPETLAETTDKNAIEPGRVYDFSDDAEALLFSGSGWSLTSSNKARWNAATEARFNFTAKSNERPLELVVQASPFFVKGNHEIQAIEVSFPSSASQLIMLQRGEMSDRFVIHIATEDISPGGAVVVKLKFLNAASPKSAGLNNDQRLLAINVKTLQVLIAED